MISEQARIMLARNTSTFGVRLSDATFSIFARNKTGKSLTSLIAQAVPGAIFRQGEWVTFPLHSLPTVLALFSPVRTVTRPRVYRPRQKKRAFCPPAPSWAPTVRNALLNLGYRKDEIKQMLTVVPSTVKNEEEALLIALQGVHS